MRTYNRPLPLRPNIAALQAYSSAREEFTGQTGVFLDANENPYGPWNRYPDPYQGELKKRIAEIKGGDPSNWFIGNGSDEIIDLAFRIFCRPGIDKALTFTPTYGMYEVAANINDVRLLQLPLDENFQIKREEVTPYLKDADLQLLFLCSPNNPTGNQLCVDDIYFLLDTFEGIVILDEAYIDFSDSPSLRAATEQYPRLIVCQTLSKAWGLAALRLGLAYMQPEVMAYFNKVKPPYNVSLANQQLALEQLNAFASFQQGVQEIKTQRLWLAQQLARLALVRRVYPSDANFLLIEVTDASAVYQQLVQAGIIVRNRHSVVANTLRISVGTPQENQQLINKLKSLSHG